MLTRKLIEHGPLRVEGGEVVTKEGWTLLKANRDITAILSPVERDDLIVLVTHLLNSNLILNREDR
jgi:hypothetical protein